MLASLGLMLGGIYGAYIIKRDLDCYTADIVTKRKDNNTLHNKDRVTRNFKYICKRAGIKTDRQGRPMSKERLDIAIEYLQYQGYTQDEIRHFEDFFMRKWRKYHTETTIDPLDRNNPKSASNRRIDNLLEKYNDAPKSSFELVIFRNPVFTSNLSAEDRMNKLLENRLWGKIVDHHSYIRGGSGVKFEEIWTLKIPKSFFLGDNHKRKIYNDVCLLQNIENTL